eukprot:366432-Chlamydomonas_euryale.AAC.10
MQVKACRRTHAGEGMQVKACRIHQLCFFQTSTCSFKSCQQARQLSRHATSTQQQTRSWRLNPIRHPPPYTCAIRCRLPACLPACLPTYLPPSSPGPLAFSSTYSIDGQRRGRSAFAFSANVTSSCRSSLRRFSAAATGIGRVSDVSLMLSCSVGTAADDWPARSACTVTQARIGIYCEQASKFKDEYHCL